MQPSSNTRTHHFKGLEIPLHSKLAILSHDTSQFSRLFCYFLATVNHFQPLTIILCICVSYLNQENTGFLWIVQETEKILLLKNLSTSETSFSLIFWIPFIILVYLLLFILLGVYLSFSIVKGDTKAQNSPIIWKALRYLHPMLIYYVVHISGLEALGHLSKGIGNESVDREKAARIAWYFVLTINFWVTLAIEFLLSINLSNNNLFSMKNKTTYYIDLIFKTAIPPIVIFVAPSKRLSVILLIISLVYCAIQTAAFFYFLPYYKINLLKTYNWVQAFMNSLILTSIISKIIIVNRNIERPVGLFLFIWSLLAIFTLKIQQNILQRLFFRIIRDFRSSSSNIYHFMHFLKIMKKYRKLSRYQMKVNKINRGVIGSLTSIMNISEIRRLNSFQDDLMWHPDAQEKIKTCLEDTFLSELKQKAFKTQNSALLQAFLAYRYTKQDSVSVIAFNIARQNTTTRSFFSNQNSFSLIKMIIFEKLRKAESTQPKTEETFESYLTYQNVENSIQVQLNLQLQFWRIFKAEKVELLTLLHQSQKIIKQSKIVQNKIQHLPECNKSGFLQPSLTLSLYYSLLENNTAKSNFYYSQFTDSVTKTSTPNFSGAETLYFILSTVEKQKGKILNHFGKLREEVDLTKQSLVGSSFSKLFPSICTSRLEAFLDNFQNHSQPKTLELAILSKDDCLLPCKLTFNFTYQPVYGLCIYALVKPLEESTRQILISRNGQILFSSKNLLRDLEIDEVEEIRGKKVTEFCPDFFNILQIKENKPDSKVTLPFIISSAKNNLKKFKVHFLITKSQIFNEGNSAYFELVLNKISTSYEEEILERKALFSYETNETNSDEIQENIAKTEPPINERNFTKQTEASETTPFPQSFQKIVLLNSSSRPLLDPATSLRQLNSPTHEARRLLSECDLILETGNPEPVISVPSDNEKQSRSLQRNFDKLERHLLSQVQQNSSLEDTKECKRKTRLRELLSSRKFSSSNKLFILTFSLIFLFLFVLLVSLNVRVSKASKKGGILSDVIQTAYFRNYWIKVSVRDIHYWQGYVQKRGGYPYDLLIGAFEKSHLYLENNSKALVTAASYLEQDLLDLFYEKNVRVSDTSLMEDTTRFDTFQASSIVINYMHQLASYAFVQNVPVDEFDRLTRLVLDNSMNDLLLVSNNLIQKVETKLFDMLSDSKNALRYTFFLSIASIILFIIISFVFVLSRNSASQKFAQILSTVQPRQIHQIQSTLLKFKQLLSESSNPEDKDHLQKISSQCSTQQQRHIFSNSRISLKKLYERNFFLFIALLVCLGLTFGFTAIYYQQSKTNLDYIQKQQINMISALTYLNVISVFNAGLQSMCILNGTSTIQNIPVVDFLLEESTKLLDVTNFQQTLTDSNGNLPAYQSMLLFNTDCDILHSKYDSYTDEINKYSCSIISDGTNYEGLSKLFLQLQGVVDDMVEKFVESDKSYDSIQMVFLDFWNFLYSYGDVANVMLLMSYEYSTNAFNDSVENLDMKSKTLALVACGICIILGLVTWIFVIKKLASLESEPKKILAVVPDQCLFNNILLEAYIKRMK